MQIKKKISKFLVGEESQIPKRALVGLGVALATIGIAAAAQTHTSATTLQYVKPDIKGFHTSHTSGTTSATTTSVPTTHTSTTTSEHSVGPC